MIKQESKSVGYQVAEAKKKKKKPMPKKKPYCKE